MISPETSNERRQAVQAAEALIAFFRGEMVPRFDAWLESVAGSEFKSAEAARKQIHHIVNVARVAGQELLYKDKPVKISVVQKKYGVLFQMRGLGSYKNTYLGSSRQLPRFTAQPANEARRQRRRGK